MKITDHALHHLEAILLKWMKITFFLTSALIQGINWLHDVKDKSCICDTHISRAKIYRYFSYNMLIEIDLEFIHMRKEWYAQLVDAQRRITSRTLFLFGIPLIFLNPWIENMHGVSSVCHTCATTRVHPFPIGQKRVIANSVDIGQHSLAEHGKLKTSCSFTELFVGRKKNSSFINHHSSCECSESEFWLITVIYMKLYLFNHKPTQKWHNSSLWILFWSVPFAD